MVDTERQRRLREKEAQAREQREREEYKRREERRRLQKQHDEELHRWTGMAVKAQQQKKQQELNDSEAKREALLKELDAKKEQERMRQIEAARLAEKPKEQQ
jgi:hypothetical protein